MRPVKKKSKIQESPRAKPRKKRQIEVIKKQETKQSRNISFGDVRNVIADTLEMHWRFPEPSRANAEAEAFLIAREILRVDGGFPIKESEFKIPLCKEHR